MNAGLPLTVIHGVGQHAERHTTRDGGADDADGPESDGPSDGALGERGEHEELADSTDGQADHHGEGLALKLLGQDRHQSGADEADELHAVEQGGQVLVAEVVLGVVGGHAVTGGLGDPVDHEGDDQDDPRPVALGCAQGVLERNRLGSSRVEVALTQVLEGKQQQDDGDHAVDGGDDHEADLGTATEGSAEEADQRDGQSGGDEGTNLAASHTEGVGDVTFLRVGGQVRQNSGDRGLDTGVYGTCGQDVGDQRVPELHGGVRQARSGERDEHGHGERDAQPQEPRTALAPLGVRVVNDGAPHDSGDGVRETRDQQNGRCTEGTGSGDAEHIGVEVHDVRRNGDVQQVASHIGEGVADLLLQRQLDSAGLRGSSCCAHWLFPSLVFYKVRMPVCARASMNFGADSLPTIRSRNRTKPASGRSRGWPMRSTE